MSRAQAWQDRSMWGGQYQLIAALLAAGSHRIEAWGNSHEGWSPYLVSGDSGIQIGPTFWVDQGERLKDLTAAAGRAYEIDPKSVRKGRNFP